MFKLYSVITIFYILWSLEQVELFWVSITDWGILKGWAVLGLTTGSPLLSTAINSGLQQLLVPPLWRRNSSRRASSRHKIVPFRSLLLWNLILRWILSEFQSCFFPIGATLVLWKTKLAAGQKAHEPFRKQNDCCSLFESHCTYEPSQLVWRPLASFYFL